MQSFENLTSSDKMRGLCFKITRSLLIIVNVIIATLAVLLIYVSLNAFSQDFELDTGGGSLGGGSLGDSPPRIVHTYVSVTLATFALIAGSVALLGLIGSVKKSKSFLGTYAAIIFLMVSILFVLVILTFTYSASLSPNQQQASTSNYKDVDKSYVNSTVVFYNYVDSSDIKTRFIDYLQRSLSCCGINSPSDWTEYSLHKIPKSCCSEPVESSLPVFKYCAESDHKIGCWKAINDQFYANLPLVRFILFMWIGFGALCTIMAGFMIWTLRTCLDVV